MGRRLLLRMLRNRAPVGVSGTWLFAGRQWTQGPESNQSDRGHYHRAAAVLSSPETMTHAQPAMQPEQTGATGQGRGADAPVGVLAKVRPGQRGQYVSRFVEHLDESDDDEKPQHFEIVVTPCEKLSPRDSMAIQPGWSSGEEAEAPKRRRRIGRRIRQRVSRLLPRVNRRSSK